MSIATVSALLRLRARQKPDAIAYTYLLDGERDEANIRWGELDRQARAIGAALQADGLQGARVLLLYVPGLEFVSAFFGCLYAGAIPVPAYPPETNRLAKTLPRLQAIARDCAPALVLTTSSLLQMAGFILAQAPDLAALRWAASEALAERREDGWSEPATRLGDLAFIQYTSGSTAVPKGVMVSHASIIANVNELQRFGGLDESSVIGMWIPFYHDLGLFCGILLPTLVGARCVLMSPVDFLRRPARWLRMLSRYRVTMTAGPNFAYDLCVEKITPPERDDLDLSSLRYAVNAAEPVRHRTIARFNDAFAPCGLRPDGVHPGYGLAEVGLSVVARSIADPYRMGYFDAAALSRGEVLEVHSSESGRPLVSCGRSVLGQRVEIVDPETRTRCAPGRVGEVWVASPLIGLGYFNRPEETVETFQARLADDDAGTPFLRTGDLAFLADGELYITGRIKDLIIIRGNNHYPQDLELTVERCHPAIRPGCVAAFAVERGGAERVAVAAEADTRRGPVDIDEITAAILQSVLAEHALSTSLVALLEPSSLPKTSSGKLQRRAARAGLVDGTLAVLHRWDAPSIDERTPSRAWRPRRALAEPQEAEVRHFLTEWTARKLERSLAEIDRMRPLAEYGMDSVMLVELVSELGEWLGRPVDLGLATAHPTIAELSVRLVRRD